MNTGLVFDERFLLHRARYDHPERPERLTAIWAGLERENLINSCEHVPARAAADAELTTVHTPDYVRSIDATAARDFCQLDPDTYTSRDSTAAARLAAGGLIDLVLSVERGRLDNGFALLRPPGHHAEADRAMGFCLFNNVAVAAQAARAHGAPRILIVDWDVHHGNGTQSTFWNDPAVLYFSTHQWPFYPGTGGGGEIGGEGARGRNINLPWPAGMGDPEYLAAFDELLLPIACEFDPDLVLVSCGFDAALGDLLGEMRVTPSGYARMTRRLKGLARGRVVLALEGGYNLDAMAKSASACVRVLQGDEPAEPPSPQPSTAARRAIDEVRRIQDPYWKSISQGVVGGR